MVIFVDLVELRERRGGVVASEEPRLLPVEWWRLLNPLLLPLHLLLPGHL